MQSLSTHVVVASAIDTSDKKIFNQALDRLNLPHLRRFLTTAHRTQYTMDEKALTSSHDVAQGTAMQWRKEDGNWPWAAWAAHEAGFDGHQGWAFFHPCHWAVSNGQVRLASAENISEKESAEIFESMQSFFLEDGIALHVLKPDLWLAQSDIFLDLTTASFDRVISRSVEDWLVGSRDATQSASVRLIRRLQNEMQMLLYTHPVNNHRHPSINSFWLSGTGRLTRDDIKPTSNVIYLDDLLEPYLNQDIEKWTAAWQILDEQFFSQHLNYPDAKLSLCGENGFQTFTFAPPNWSINIRNALRQPTLSQLIS
ncbi:MAG: hypothetical protein EXR35_03500 [Limnohabitans sp.]|nr:hypothetical protein [Limnohabitans sp.]